MASKRILVSVGAEKLETAAAFMALVETAIERVFDEYEGEPVVLTMLPKFAGPGAQESSDNG